MDLLHFLQIHGLTRAAKVLNKSISTIQSWRDSGKVYRVLQDDNGDFFAWERK